MDTAVVIISHNYGRFLQECIDSVRSQVVAPREIIVIADRCTDATADVATANGIKCHVVDFGNVTQSRWYGMGVTKSPILCFLDADDKLSPDYIRRGLETFTQGIGIVHSDCWRFGEQDGRSDFNADITFTDIDHVNQIHAGSLVRREALIASDAFFPSPGGEIQDDWFLWRRILQHGWRARKSPAVYHYRRHDSNASKIRTRQNYYDRAGLAYETLTLVIPFSGRADLLNGMLDFLDRQRWPKRQLSLLFIDGSDSHEFNTRLKQWAFYAEYPDVRIVKREFGRPGLADEDRHQNRVRVDVQEAVARLYSWVRTQVTSRFTWIIEDDVLPPLDAAERLLRGFDDRIDSVTAVVPSRYHSGAIAWDAPGKMAKSRKGVQTIGGNGFGCVMLRTSALQSSTISSSPKHPDYDHEFYIQRTPGTCRIDWGCVCEHRDSIQREDRKQDKTLTPQGNIS